MTWLKLGLLAIESLGTMNARKAGKAKKLLHDVRSQMSVVRGVCLNLAVLSCLEEKFIGMALKSD